MTGAGITARVLVFQHLDVEHPGSLGQLLEEAGAELVTVELDTGDPVPDLEPFDLLIVMGGPMDVWEENLFPWMVSEKAAIRRWVTELDRPFLGVCLGHQLLADSLGGAVTAMAEPEVGAVRIGLTEAAATDALFSSMAPVIDGLQWHGAEISALPPRSTVLATNDACAVQAFRVGSRAWGVQFHVEALATTVAQWAAVPAYAEALDQSEVSVDVLAAAVQRRLGAMNRTARALGDGLLALIAVQRQDVGSALPSGAAAERPEPARQR